MHGNLFGFSNHLLQKWTLLSGDLLRGSILTGWDLLSIIFFLFSNWKIWIFRHRKEKGIRRNGKKRERKKSHSRGGMCNILIACIMTHFRTFYFKYWCCLYVYSYSSNVSLCRVLFLVVAVIFEFLTSSNICRWNYIIYMSTEVLLTKNIMIQIELIWSWFEISVFIQLIDIGHVPLLSAIHCYLCMWGCNIQWIQMFIHTLKKFCILSQPFSY